MVVLVFFGLASKCHYKNLYFFFDLKAVSIVSILLIFMLTKCD